MIDKTANAHALQARTVAKERSSGESISIGELPAGASIVHVLGVDYVHTADETLGDLYLTAAGFPYAEFLHPDSWFETSWFRSQRERLEGTGLVYAVPAKPIRGETIVLVVKFSRVGEEVPIDTNLIENVLCCEFNGPFEEFGLVEELRLGRRAGPDLQITTQLPLAIYVPPERTQPSQSGRFQWRIARKVAQHPGIAIDILREYVMIYRWLPGIDAWQAQQMGLLSADEVTRLNERAMAELRVKGFSVLDMKPEHLIVGLEEHGQVVRGNGQIRYGLVDFELLERTPDYWQELQAARRMAYHRRRRDVLRPDGRVETDPGPLPENLHAVRILDVDYIHGRAESTGGMLWVMGRDPELFEYFLPERWRTTHQLRFAEIHETYFTTSKDNVRLVWKVSRVGEPPEAAASGVDGFRVLASGFNSPFEEIAAALWLRRRGIATITPCAVYRTGHRSQLDESLFDRSRYRTHAEFSSLDGEPILDPRRNYITIWDFWSKQKAETIDDAAAVARSVNAMQAVDRGLLDPGECDALVAKFEDRLRAEGVEVFRLMPTHILLSIGEDGSLARDERGLLDSCLCNFQYLRLPCWP